MKKYLFSIILILPLFSITPNILLAMTADEIIAEIRVKVGDTKTDTNNQHWSSGTLLNRINIVQDYIAKETLCIQARISTSAITNQREYDFNSDVISPIRYGYNIYGSTPPAYKRLVYWTIAGLDKEMSGWENGAAGLPTKYYERGDKYGLDPIPSSVYASTYAVQIDYFKKPDTLDSGSDIPFDGNILLYTYHDLIIKGVVIMCKDDDRIDTSTLKNEYYALVQKMGLEIKARNDKQGGFGVKP